jgi:hypothetical protein
VLRNAIAAARASFAVWSARTAATRPFKLSPHWR